MIRAIKNLFNIDEKIENFFSVKFDKELETMNKEHSESEIGLVIDYNFHKRRSWVCAGSYYLFDRIIKELRCIVITNQKEYEKFSSRIKVVISAEPGWAAPWVRYNNRHIKYIYLSDPHNNVRRREDFLQENKIDYVLSPYYYPFLFHLKKWPKDRLLHFPWAIDEQFICRENNIYYSEKRMIDMFGALQGEAYSTRRWCKNFKFVDYHDNSGCENKSMSDIEYFQWIRQYDVMLCAGSIDGRYQLVTPKYFETMAAGSLLFAQYCQDLELLGMVDQTNCVVFTEENFEKKAYEIIENRKEYERIRLSAVGLIQSRHSVGQRIEFLKRHINENNSINI